MAQVKCNVKLQRVENVKTDDVVGGKITITYDQSQEFTIIMREGRDPNLPFAGDERADFDDTIYIVQGNFKDHSYINEDGKEVSEYFTLPIDFKKDLVAKALTQLDADLKSDDPIFTTYIVSAHPASPDLAEVIVSKDYIFEV
ncbi:MAG: hypothetical protein J0H68_04270 [Sphingobacteriia bacterium]|nr:hypothetical protein [Sphingobacteriia bacterium]